MKLVLAAFLQWVVFEGLLRESVCTKWTVQLPETISAVEGSCVVIPVHLHPQRCGSIHHSGLVHSRSIFQSLTVYNGEDPLKVKDLCARCKVYLVFPNPLHVCLFSAETPQKPRISNPGLLTEGQPVTVNCTAEYTCPSNPPTVDWGGVNGTVILQYTAKQQVAWAVTSSITFTPSYRDSQIQCQVTYPGRDNATEHRLIHVKYAPKDTEILVWTRDIKEGSSVSMSCSSKGDPPISRYSWFLVQGGQEVDLEQHTEKVRVPNVTRGVQFYCTAENKIGQTQSPRKSLNVEYKPDITGESKCTFSPGEMYLEQWRVGDQCPDRALQVQTNASCAAFNKHGETVYVLPFHAKESLLWMIVPVVGGLACLLFILLIAITVFCCRKRRGRHFIHQPRMYSLCDPSIYQKAALCT
ncbi:sialic acid-binding Ig-like lectin 5 isoform X1 [Acipenser oxyrinchus oxyrinchus]|uniref:Sialic acid-binding Ig-like lectin 5 isoform X1 n=1 Tax=Acipenser oxyrinchus oxyrinchus TaxID=40147 RepID=A0AAD8CEA2_ACIOX|nr:sialic acid-binding Ig-like lectin 5 isoform X1 [Acipenser oxyrinchus oxyrinchus]